METPKEAKEIFKEVDGMINAPVNAENLSEDGKKLLKIVRENLSKAFSIESFMKLQKLPNTHRDIEKLADFLGESVSFCDAFPQLLSSAIYHDFMTEEERRDFNSGNPSALDIFSLKNKEFAGLVENTLFASENILQNILNGLKNRPVAAAALCINLSTLKGL